MSSTFDQVVADALAVVDQLESTATLHRDEGRGIEARVGAGVVLAPLALAAAHREREP